MACYQGFYHQSYDIAARKFIDNTRNIPEWRVNLAINLLLPRIRNQVAKLLRTRPIFDVLPASTDVEDIDIAYCGKRTLQGIWYQQDFNYKFIDLLYWIALTGNGFGMPYWDPFSGPQQELTSQDFVNENDLKSVFQTAQQAQGEEQQREAQEQIQFVLEAAQKRFNSFVEKNNGNELFLGILRWEIVPPFDILFPSGTNFEDKSWLIKAQIRERSFYEHLDIDTEDFTLTDYKDKRYVSMNRRFDAMHHSDQIGASNQVDMDEDDILELHLWLPVSERFKRGFHAVIAGGKVIRKGPNPYEHREVPCIHFCGEKVPGKIHGVSSGEQALSEIKSYNKTKSRIMEITNLMSRPKWLVPISARIPKNSITSEPAEIIRYAGVIKPEPAKMPELPLVFDKLMQSNIRDIDEITAQREPTRGMNPAGGRSAALAQQLKSTDEGNLAVIGLILDNGLSHTGRLMLSVVNQFMTENRLISYTGEKNKHIAFTFKNGSLLGKNKNQPGADYFNVRVTTFTQFGLDRAGQQEALNSLLQYQIFKPEDRSKIFQWLEMGWFEDEIDETKRDRSTAHRENLEMAQGQQQNPKLEENHQAHKEEHIVFMTGQDFRNLDPQIQEIFRQHLFMTELKMVQEVVKPQMLAQLAQLMTLQEIAQRFGEKVVKQMMSLAQGPPDDSRRNSSGGSSGSRGKDKGTK